METVEEAGASVECMNAVAKGKRTKRQRLIFSPPGASPASSAELSGSTTEEEEDMANCLILLARGRVRELHPPAPETSGNRRFADGGKAAGFYVYECKTCNKCFPSFQALGGHRASHKRPKLALSPAAPVAQEIAIEFGDEDALQISLNSFSKGPAMALPTAGGKPKVHECSVCGAEFSSGQALGGHMRRHRPLSLPDAKKERSNLLSLDLNLPAPTDDSHNEFARPPLPLLVSASALVDCHY